MCQPQDVGGNSFIGMNEGVYFNTAFLPAVFEITTCSILENEIEMVVESIICSRFIHWGFFCSGCPLKEGDDTLRINHDGLPRRRLLKIASDRYCPKKVCKVNYCCPEKLYIKSRKKMRSGSGGIDILDFILLFDRIVPL